MTPSMRIKIGDGYDIAGMIRGGWHLASDHGHVDPE